MKKFIGFISAFLMMAPLFAQEAVAGSSGSIEKGLLALGAGFAIGVAALGGGIGMGHAASATIEGSARNPETSKRLMLLFILAIAFIESLVIYALLIAFMLFGKI